MRNLLLSVVALLGVACQAAPPQVADTPGERRGALGLSARAIKGVVNAPPGLIGVDAGTLIGVDAGTLIGVDAGTLLPGARLRLSQAGMVPLGGAAVVLAGPDGVPVQPLVTAITDAQGRFTVRARTRGGVLVALARGPAGAAVRLSAIPGAAPPAGDVAISPASTAVTAALMAEARDGRKNFSALGDRDYAAAVEAVAVRVASVPVEQLTDATALAAVYRAAVAENEALRAGFERLKAALTTAVYDPEPAAAPAEGAPPQAPNGGPGAALVEQPEPTATPAPTGSLGPEPWASPSPVAEPSPGPVASAPTEAQTPAPDPTPTPVPPPPPLQRVFQVNATMPSCEAWADSGLDLVKSDLVDIVATGTWRWNATKVEFGPAGDPQRLLSNPWMGCQGPLDGERLGALVMRTNQGARLVGEGLSALKGLSGRLSFKMNDSDTSDNGNSFVTVTVTITR
ncbi:MAG: hypothetical protein VKQ33_00445 [Candidatus Sericytochromatia bacterium]|nr:hypothetical protein [Candidatus Sericytochromatia bacterium]